VPCSARQKNGHVLHGAALPRVNGCRLPVGATMTRVVKCSASLPISIRSRRSAWISFAGAPSINLTAGRGDRAARSGRTSAQARRTFRELRRQVTCPWRQRLPCSAEPPRRPGLLLSRPNSRLPRPTSPGLARQLSIRFRRRAPARSGSAPAPSRVCAGTARPTVNAVSRLQSVRPPVSVRCGSRNEACRTCPAPSAPEHSSRAPVALRGCISPRPVRM
jgi:hypothetical protein